MDFLVYDRAGNLRDRDGGNKSPLYVYLVQGEWCVDQSALGRSTPQQPRVHIRFRSAHELANVGFESVTDIDAPTAVLRAKFSDVRFLGQADITEVNPPAGMGLTPMAASSAKQTWT